MAKHAIKTGQSIAKKRGIWPLDVLFDQLEKAIKEENDTGAFRVALELAPYCHRKMAHIPADEVAKALNDGRLVVLGPADQTE